MKDIKKRLKDILLASNSLIIYRGLKGLPPWQALEKLITGVTEGTWDTSKLVKGYYEFLNTLLSSHMFLNHDFSWKEWVLDNLLYMENNFTIWAETREPQISRAMAATVDHDLDCIKKIAHFPWQDFIFLLEEISGLTLLNVMPDWKESWEDICAGRGLGGWNIDSLTEYYEKEGSGLFSMYKGFYWNGSALESISYTDPITLEQLLGYDIQKEILLDNTEKFISGYPANNILLYGDKGTGKSSMVKALIHRYSKMGLRIIELPKIHLDDYHAILDYIEGRMFKFILFIDDLSFEDHEVEYKHIKALLEGGLKVRPSNLLVYATSNRRHLVKEVMSDRNNIGYQTNHREEVSPMDSMQEKLSLADRFGITLTFISPNQKGYLEMIESMARERGINMDKETLYEKALRWEKRYNGRSGRTAKQFIDDLIGGM